MTVKKTLVIMALAAALLLAACQGGPGQGPGGNSGNAGGFQFATPEPPQVASDARIDVPADAALSTDALPDVDFIGQLVTQAYEEVDATPPAGSPTATPSPTPLAFEAGTSAADTETGSPAAVAGSSGYVSPLLVTPTAFAPAPLQVVNTNSVLIPNGVMSADCFMVGIGDCQPTMTAGGDIHMTWYMGTKGPARLEYAQSVVIVTRDGVPFQTIISTDGTEQNPPDAEKDEMWILNVGETAEFRAGLEDVQPGFYEAKLRICLMVHDACNVGRGWTDSGGATIRFLITED